MDERISIPTSDSAERPPRSRTTLWMPLVAGISILVAILVVTGDADPVVVDPARDGEITPPPQVETPARPALDAFAFPSTGVVTAVEETEGTLVAAVTGEVWGSSLWRLDDDSGTWTLTDPLPAITVLDVIAHPEGVAAVGFDRFDRSPALYVGPIAGLRRIPIELATGEVPYELDLVSGAMYVFTRFDGGASRAAYRVDADGLARRLRAPAGDAFVDDVVSSDGTVVAVGRDNGRPAMWRVGFAADLQPIDIDLDLEIGRIAAAGRLPSGEIVGLVVGEFSGELPSTAVYRLQPPYGRLSEPIPGIWDRLVPAGSELLALPEDLVALPASGVTVYRTDSGVGWVAGRARFTGPGGGGPGEGTIAISDAVFRESGALVLSGASTGRTSAPVVASEAPIGDASTVPSARWRPVDGFEPGRQVVHLGGIQVAVSEGVVTLRDDFGGPWRQPVFADESSVGGLVEVVELDFGYLLSATRPYRSLWFSSDGSAWQLIARDVLRVAGSGGSAIAVVGRPEAPDILEIDVGGLDLVASDGDPLVVAADGLGLVPTFGYVAGPVEGGVYVSEDGVEWTALDLEADVEAVQFGIGTVAVRTVSGWLRYDSGSRDLEPIRSPVSGGPLPMRLTLTVDGGLWFSDRAQAWVTTDFVNWTDVSLGAWEGADGELFEIWADEREVVAVVGDDSQRTLVRLER